MKILHLSDTHLGYAAYRKSEPSTGLNQREIDVYNAFSEIIDYAVKTKPDLIIHAGDLFDNVRPNNRAIREAVKQIIRLASEKIPIVIVSGNHSTPRLKTTSSIFEILEYFPNVHPVFRGNYETKEFGDVKVHIIPHAQSPQSLKKSFKKLAVDNKFKYNVLASHTGVTGIKEFSMGEFNEQIIPVSILPKNFNYIALGHYHKFIKVSDNAYYSGSTERFSFNEAGGEKGFVEVDLDNGHVRHIPIKSRKMIDIPPIDCTKLDARQVMQAIENNAGAMAENIIVRMTLQNISRTVYVALDFNRINELRSKITHFEIKYEWKKEDGTVGSLGTAIGGLADEFKCYLAQEGSLNKREKEHLKKIGLEYLDRAIESGED